MAIRGVAIVGGVDNRPLFIAGYGFEGGEGAGGGRDVEGERQMHVALHCALDAVEERILAAREAVEAARDASRSAAAVAARSPYAPGQAPGVMPPAVPPVSESHFDCHLGVIYPTDRFCVYGRLANTGTKLLVVADAADEVHDVELRALFRRLHAGFADACCNPFYVRGTKITSERFGRFVDTLVRKSEVQAKITAGMARATIR